MSEGIYVVYLYCDYRKEVDIQHVKAFKSRDSAIEFAKKYSNDENNERYSYVCIRGTEYDSELFYCNQDKYIDDELEKRKELEKEIHRQLHIKKDMWHIRIAVDKVLFE
jgi:hypothetical protein